MTVTQLTKGFPTTRGTRRLITVFKIPRHWSLTWASWLTSQPYNVLP